MYSVYYNDHDFYSAHTFTNIDKVVEFVELMRMKTTIMLENGDKIAYHNPSVGTKYLV